MAALRSLELTEDFGGAASQQEAGFGASAFGISTFGIGGEFPKTRHVTVHGPVTDEVVSWATELPDGTYYWRARVTDPEGSTSGWTELRSFTVISTQVYTTQLISGLGSSGALATRPAKVLTGALGPAYDSGLTYDSGAYDSGEGDNLFSTLTTKQYENVLGVVGIDGVLAGLVRRALIGALAPLGVVTGKARHALLAILAFSASQSDWIRRSLVAAVSAVSVQNRYISSLRSGGLLSTPATPPELPSYSWHIDASDPASDSGTDPIADLAGSGITMNLTAGTRETFNDIKVWNLDAGYMTQAAGTDYILGQQYTAWAWVDWRDTDSGWRTLHRGDNDHWIIVENGFKRLGMYSNRNGGFRPIDTGYNIDPTAGWQLVVAVGHGDSPTATTGRTEFYVNGEYVGQSDRVASGTKHQHIGLSGQGPGRVTEAGTHATVALTPSQVRGLFDGTKAKYGYAVEENVAKETSARRRGTVSLARRELPVAIPGLAAWWRASEASRYTQEVIADRPVGYWRLGESDTTFVDMVGGMNGAEVGALTRVTGALVSDNDVGARNYTNAYGNFVSVPHNAKQNMSYMTGEAWVIRGATITQAAGDYIIMNKENEYESGIFRVSDTEGSFRVALYTTKSGTWYWMDGGARVPYDDAWHHIVYTFDGTTVRFYVDGAPAGTRNMNTGHEGPLRPGVEPLKFMARGGTGTWWLGGVDEAAIYDYVLSPERIKAHYEAGKGRVGVLPDSSGNENDATELDPIRWPEFVPASAEFNGHPVLRFDNAGITKQHLISLLNLSASDNTVFLVARQLGSSGRILSGYGNNWLLGWWSTREDQYYANGWVNNPATAVTTAMRCYVGDGTVAGDQWSFWRGRTNINTNSIAGSQGPNGLVLGGGYMISTNGLDQGEHSTCEIAEVIVYDRRLTAVERATVVDYLDRRYEFEGLVAESAGLSRYTITPKVAALAVIGAMVRKTGQAQTGIVAITGTAARTLFAERLIAGVLGATASVNIAIGRTLSGALAFASSLARASERVLASSLSPAGIVKWPMRQVVSSGLTTSSSLGYQGKRVLEATLSTGSMLGRRGTRALVASVSFTASQADWVRVSLVAALSPTGVMTRTASLFRALTSTILGTGTLSRRFAREFAAAISYGAALTRAVDKVASGAIGLTGVAARGIGAIRGGTLTASGVMVKIPGRVLQATITALGSMSRMARLRRSLLALLAPSSTSSASKVVVQALIASVGANGILLRLIRAPIASGLAMTSVTAAIAHRLLSGEIASVGAVVRAVRRTLLASAISPTSASQRITKISLVATFVASAVLNRLVPKTFVSSLSGSGNVRIQGHKTLDSALSAVANVVGAGRKTLVATLSFSSLVPDAVSKVLVGNVGLTGVFSRVAVLHRSVSAGLVAGATLGRKPTHVIAAFIAPGAQLVQRTNTKLLAALSSSGDLATWLFQQFPIALGAVLTSAGALRSAPRHLLFSYLDLAGRTGANISRTLGGVLEPLGERAKHILVRMAVSLSLQGAIYRGMFRSVSGTLSPWGHYHQTYRVVLGRALGFAGGILTRFLFYFARNRPDLDLRLFAGTKARAGEAEGSQVDYGPVTPLDGSKKVEPAQTGGTRPRTTGRGGGSRPRQM